MLYIDTSNVEEIKKYKELGIIQGITTNQKILQQEGQTDVKQAIQKILEVSDNLPVNVELTKTSGSDEDLIFEAHEYYDLSKKTIIIKVPMWSDGRGIKIAKQLSHKAIPVNMTCCMSVEQALIAASAGVNYISLFFRRIVDYNISIVYHKDLAYLRACETIKNSYKLINEYGYDSQLIVGSIRQPEDVTNALLSDADIVTVPPKILSQMFQHPKTDETIKEFDDVWKAINNLYPIHNHLDTEPCTENCPNFRAKK